MLKRLLKYLGLSLLVWSVGFCFFYRKELLYGIEQGMGQLKIITNIQEVDDLLKDPHFPDSAKQKLQLIQEIRIFAFEELGIKENQNYTSFYDQKGAPIIYVVTAAPEFKLEAYQWKFPVAGKFPYLGFFDKTKAETEKKRLEQLGYDTHLGGVSGWSTLGWLRDPILSQMLNYSEGKLSALIIHELTHGTLYVKDSAAYNENLASFIGEIGSINYYKKKYGEDSFQYQEHLTQLNNQKIFSKLTMTTANRLDSLYNSFEPNLPLSVKRKMKAELIYEFKENIRNSSLYDSEIYRRYLNSRLNNTFFTTSRIYDRYFDHFKKELEEDFNGDVKAYLNYLKEKYPSL